MLNSGLLQKSYEFFLMPNVLWAVELEWIKVGDVGLCHSGVFFERARHEDRMHWQHMFFFLLFFDTYLAPKMIHNDDRTWLYIQIRENFNHEIHTMTNYWIYYFLFEPSMFLSSLPKNRGAFFLEVHQPIRRQWFPPPGCGCHGGLVARCDATTTRGPASAPGGRGVAEEAAKCRGGRDLVNLVGKTSGNCVKLLQ